MCTINCGPTWHGRDCDNIQPVVHVGHEGTTHFEGDGCKPVVDNLCVPEKSTDGTCPECHGKGYCEEVHLETRSITTWPCLKCKPVAGEKWQDPIGPPSVDMKPSEPTGEGPWTDERYQEALDIAELMPHKSNCVRDGQFLKDWVIQSWPIIKGRLSMQGEVDESKKWADEAVERLGKTNEALKVALADLAKANERWKKLRKYCSGNSDEGWAYILEFMDKLEAQ